MVRSQLVSPTLPGRLVQYCHDDYRDGLRAPDRIEDIWRDTPSGQHHCSGRYPDHDHAHSGFTKPCPIGVAYAECRGRRLPSQL